MSLKEQNLEQKNPTNDMSAFYIYIHFLKICVYRYTQTQRERERERERAAKILHNGLAT